MSINSVNASIASMNGGNLSLSDVNAGGADDSYEDNYSDALMKSIEDELFKRQEGVIDSSKMIGKGLSSAADFQVASLEYKTFANALSAMAGNLMKSLNRLQQING